MSLRKMTPEVREALAAAKEAQDALRAMGNRSREDFRTPTLAPKVLIDRLGFSRPLLNKWLHDRVFELDCDRVERGKNEARLFSPRDVILLAAGALCSGVGLPRKETKRVAESIVQYWFDTTGEVMGFTSDVEIVVCPKAGVEDWQVVLQYRLPGSPEPTIARVLRDGKWHKPDEPIAFAAARFTIDLDRFLTGALLACGIHRVVGDQHTFARAAKVMARTEKKGRR